MQHGRKQARFHGKRDKTGGTLGRPSCQSSLLRDPDARFSVENVAKATKNKRRRDLTSQTQPKRRSNNGGRHVGLDFYDLLIEALMRWTPTRCNWGSLASTRSRASRIFCLEGNPVRAAAPPAGSAPGRWARNPGRPRRGGRSLPSPKTAHAICLRALARIWRRRLPTVRSSPARKVIETIFN